MTPAQPTPDKPRLHYIDFMKGLCIILIVIHHENEHIFILLIELPLIKAFTTLLPRFTAQAPLFDKGWRLRCTFFGDRGRNIAKK